LLKREDAKYLSHNGMTTDFGQFNVKHGWILREARGKCNYEVNLHTCQFPFEFSSQALVTLTQELLQITYNWM